MRNLRRALFLVAFIALPLVVFGKPPLDDYGNGHLARVASMTPAGPRIEFRLANITTGGGAPIISPDFTVPANSCVVACLASVFQNPILPLVQVPTYLPSYGGDDSPDEVIVNQDGIPDPSLLGENLYVWQWNAAAGFANRAVRVDFEDGDIPDKMTLYVYYLINIQSPFTDYPASPVAPLEAGVNSEFGPIDSDPAFGPGMPAESGEISVCMHYTNGPVGDDAGTWGDGFVSGGRGGTSGGLAGENCTIDVAWRHPAINTAFNVSKSGFTSRGMLAYNKVFRSVVP